MARKVDYDESRKYAIETIRNFLDGTGGAYDWDDFISLPLGYADLEELQRFCNELSETHPPAKKSGWYCSEGGFRVLRARLEDLEAIGVNLCLSAAWPVMNTDY
jgi:hypothetical protein